MALLLLNLGTAALLVLLSLLVLLLSDAPSIPGASNTPYTSAAIGAPNTSGGPINPADPSTLVGSSTPGSRVSLITCRQ